MIDSSDFVDGGANNANALSLLASQGQWSDVRVNATCCMFRRHKSEQVLIERKGVWI